MTYLEDVIEIVYIFYRFSLPTGTNTLVKGSLKVSPREKLLSDQPELLQQFGLDLLPVLVQVVFVAFATK